jgi:3-deoxy-manno-octulosonate cytidylyltransferase (CMP-KDO synthetase)
MVDKGRSIIMTIAIIIPARYGSTRFEGKPLALINGKAMIDHTVDIAKAAAEKFKGARVIVATDDARIEAHCLTQGHEVLMTSDACKTGSDRVFEAAIKITPQPDIVINLQGDAPLTPIIAVEKVIHEFSINPDVQVVTPVQKLTWDDLDRLRRNKQTTPFTGTTAVINKHGRALWFSKTILPAIRKEDKYRHGGELSPVHQHLGLYGYRFDILKKFMNLPEGTYEAMEGLEQLRFLENDIPIQTVQIPHSEIVQSGVDSPEDIPRAEAIIKNRS